MKQINLSMRNICKTRLENLKRLAKEKAKEFYINGTDITKMNQPIEFYLYYNYLPARINLLIKLATQNQNSKTKKELDENTQHTLIRLVFSWELLCLHPSPLSYN